MIYQIDHGHYAFSPVQDGAINQAADADSVRAVNEAKKFLLEDKEIGSIYLLQS